MPSRPSVSGRDYFTVDPRRAALIVIDMQNAFVAEGSPLETPPARAMLPKLERLIRFSRECGIPIIWTQSDHRPPFGGLMLKKFPVIGNNRMLWRGESTFDMYPDMLQPQEGKREYVIVKHKFDAFFETDLDAILRYHDVNTVIITGTATNVCCESTARAAYMRDYFVAFPHDTNATFDDAMHQATLKNIDLFFGRVMSTDELIAEMEEGLASTSRATMNSQKESA
jgi:ureidoacrylate peracid hydrolase